MAKTLRPIEFEIFKPRRGGGRPASFSHNDAERRFRDGEKIGAIAASLGVRHKAVYLALWKRGVRVREPSRS